LDNGERLAIFKPREEHQSYPGRLHGGIVSTILDKSKSRISMLKNRTGKSSPVRMIPNLLTSDNDGAGPAEVGPAGGLSAMMTSLPYHLPVDNVLSLDKHCQKNYHGLCRDSNGPQYFSIHPVIPHENSRFRMDATLNTFRPAHG